MSIPGDNEEGPEPASDPLLQGYGEKNPELSPQEPVRSTGKKPRLKWLRRIFSYLFLLVALVVVVGYHYILSPGFIEGTGLDLINKSLNGKVSFKVQQASLFRGFIFDDVKVLAGPEFNQMPVVKIKRVS